MNQSPPTLPKRNLADKGLVTRPRSSSLRLSLSFYSLALCDVQWKMLPTSRLKKKAKLSMKASPFMRLWGFHTAPVPRVDATWLFYFPCLRHKSAQHLPRIPLCNPNPLPAAKGHLAGRCSNRRQGGARGYLLQPLFSTQDTILHLHLRPIKA